MTGKYLASVKKEKENIDYLLKQYRGAIVEIKSQQTDQHYVFEPPYRIGKFRTFINPGTSITSPVYLEADGETFTVVLDNFWIRSPYIPIGYRGLYEEQS